MKIRPKQLNKLDRLKIRARNAGVLHYWLLPTPPRRKKRLPQLNKANSKLKQINPRSELVIASEQTAEAVNV